MSTWQEKAREGLRKTAEFVSKHGGDVGVTGGVVAASVAIGALATGSASGSGEAMTIADSGARTMLTIGILHASGWLGAKSIADRLLAEETSGQRSWFDNEWVAKSGANDIPQKGASLHSFGEITETREFKDALKNALQELEANPDGKAAMIKMLKESPNAQQQFVDLWNNHRAQHNPANTEAIAKLTHSGGLQGAYDDELKGPSPG